jgi:hypothetical protein
MSAENRGKTATSTCATKTKAQVEPLKRGPVEPARAVRAVEGSRVVKCSILAQASSGAKAMIHVNPVACLYPYSTCASPPPLASEVS